MTCAEFEQKLAGHCAPALAGIKPANIVSLYTEGEGGLEALVDRYQRLFEKKGICFRILCQCGERTLLMVYRPEALRKALIRDEARSLLNRFGYETGDLREGSCLPGLLDTLSRRIRERENCTFPHEIGLFLGYPIEDVTGFIENQGGRYLYSGYWKVYSDVERAKSQFARYENVRAGMLRVIGRGKSICDMFGIRTAA